MEFLWQPMDMSLFHATDDRMLSHIGGGLSRHAKRRHGYKKSHDHPLFGSELDDERKRKASKGWVSRRKDRQVVLPKHEKLGTRFRGKYMPPVQATYTDESKQHRRHVKNQLQLTAPQNRFQLLDTAIPPPHVGPLIAQHKIAEVDSLPRGARSWQVAERVQDNISGPLGDTSIVQRSSPLPYGPVPRRARRLPAIMGRKQAHIESSDILGKQMIEAPPASHMKHSEMAVLDVGADTDMPHLDEGKAPHEPRMTDRQADELIADQLMEPQMPSQYGPEEVVDPERVRQSLVPEEVDMRGVPEVPEPAPFEEPKMEDVGDEKSAEAGPLPPVGAVAQPPQSLPLSSRQEILILRNQNTGVTCLKKSQNKISANRFSEDLKLLVSNEAPKLRKTSPKCLENLKTCFAIYPVRICHP